MSVTVLIVALDEEQALPALVERLAALDPRPTEILLVDGGSMDGTVEIARSAGWRVLAAERGRALQINLGVKAARSELVCVLHADTLPPTDMVAMVEQALADPRTALASFTPVIRGPQGTRWVTTSSMSFPIAYTSIRHRASPSDRTREEPCAAELWPERGCSSPGRRKSSSPGCGRR